MKRILFRVFFIIFLAFVLPAAVTHYKNMAETTEKIHIVNNVENNLDVQNSSAKNAENDEPPASQTENDGTPSRTITVLIHGDVHEMTLEDYTAGALAAEMPASFPEEALKAQAVAARTFAVYKQSLGTDTQHPNAAVCADYTHCAAFVDLDTEAKQQWGSNAAAWTEKIKTAVRETSGQVVTYNGTPIAAVFHSAAAKQTEAAVSVWGTDIPYLTTVDSDGDADCPKYDASVTFGAEEFRQIMLSKYPDINLTGLPKTWFTDIDTSEAGGVRTCKIGGQELKGTEVRALFGLNSTHFTIKTTDTSLTFHTQGYGHGVGMSQYGARNMAENGKGYREILTHYYTDTQITALGAQ